MSFLPAVQREIIARRPRDPVRATLEYLLENAVGHQNAVPLSTIVAHLQSIGLNLTETGFQQTVLAESRGRDYFIGSGRRGYFLIDSLQDAKVMAAFYEVRIQAEQQTLQILGDKRPLRAGTFEATRLSLYLRSP
jgi:hypothetical protein